MSNIFVKKLQLMQLLKVIVNKCMKTVNEIPNYCYPINYSVDYDKLYSSVVILLERLGLNIATINQQCLFKFAYAINLTYHPGLTGEDRWTKFAGQHDRVVYHGLNEANFTEFLEEMKDLYIGEIINDIYKQHNGKFQGRAQLIWLGARQRYTMHKDPHTPNRYHIPILTNQLCFWTFTNDLTEAPVKLHMPADGRVWYVNPVALYHNFINDSPMSRLHLLLTSGF